MKQYPLIELPGLDPIEAEKVEVLVNPSGIAYAIGGKSHARGGTKMVAEPGSYILSKHLKLDPKVSKTLGYEEKSQSPAQLSAKSQTEMYKAVMDSPDENRYDAIAKKTAALMFQKNAVRQDMIYMAQEQLKKKKGMKNDLVHAQSRIGKFQSGGATGGPESLGSWFIDKTRSGEVFYDPSLKKYTAKLDDGSMVDVTDQGALENIDDYRSNFRRDPLVDNNGQFIRTTSAGAQSTASKTGSSPTSAAQTNRANVPEVPPADLTDVERFNLNNPGFKTDWGFGTGDMTREEAVAYQNSNLKQNLNFTVTGNSTLLDPRASRSPGWSAKNDKGTYQTFHRLFANDPFFSPDMAEARKTGKYTPEQRKNLEQRQQVLSTLPAQLKDRPEEALMYEKSYAKYVKQADEIEMDKNLDKFVIGQDGKEIPLASTTDEQIDAAKGFRWFNKTTGKNDLVDYKDRQNQLWDPVGIYDINPDPEPKKQDTRMLPIPPGGPVASQSTKSLPVPSIPGALKKGMDWQSIINGTQIGLLAADLATTRTKPPYYDYAPSEIAYTRFEPINTKQQERAFNVAAERINNSNMSAQQKAAYLASMHGTMSDGVNQVDITNYQNKLANDNRNINLYDQRRNTDIQRQQDSNQRYVQEADRRNFEAARDRQNYAAGIMDVWNRHIENRRDAKLVDQAVPGYDYSFNNEQVQFNKDYRPPNYNRLQAFQSKNDIDPSLLNDAGLRKYGFKKG